MHRSYGGLGFGKDVGSCSGCFTSRQSGRQSMTVAGVAAVVVAVVVVVAAAVVVSVVAVIAETASVATR